ncbi:MAG: ABC transporter permease [Vicinamibacterales bacterium]
METLLQDIRYAARSLVKAPGFAALTILTLALGIGANTAIFSVVNAVVLRPLPYPQPERLVYVTTQFPTLGFDQFWMSMPEFLEYRQWSTLYDVIGAYTVGASNLGADQPMRPVRAAVTEDLIPALGVAPIRGRGFTKADTLPGAEDVAILSTELWQRAFGADPSVLNRVVDIDGAPTRIVGIMPRGFDVHDQRVELWLPLTIDPANPGNRGGHFLYLVGRLKANVGIDQARAELDTLIRRWNTDFPGTHTPHPVNHRLRIDPLKEDIIGSVATALWVLQGAVAFVLLIACANLANLLLARAETRQREFAVRAALGAGMGRMLRQFVTEGVILALVAAVAGVGLAYLGLDLIVATNSEGIPFANSIRIDGSVLLFTLGVAVLTGFIFGLAPLMLARGLNLNNSLKEAGTRGSSAGAGRKRLRNLLVVAEVALAVVLVIGAGLLIRSFANLMRVDAGFDRSRMVTFGLVLPTSRYQPPQRVAFFSRLTGQLRQLPGVRAVSLMSGLPPLRAVNANDTDFEHITGNEAGDDTPSENVDYWQYVSHEYVETMGIPVVKGRDFEPQDIGGNPVLLINETLASTFYEGIDPIGRRIKPGFADNSPWATIVGVLKDVKQGGISDETGTELYMLYDQTPHLLGGATGSMNIVVRTETDPAALAPDIRRIVREADATLPLVRYRSMDEVFAAAVARPRFLTTLLGIFAGLALLLAAIGTYGILSYAVTERRQEIGIRMALGASRKSVLAMVLRHGLVLAGVGLILGLGASVLLTRVLQAQLFNVQPIDPVTMAAVSVFISIVAMLACLIPARRATTVDPMIVLRQE